MVKRGLNSPDWGDALALTFAFEVAPREAGRGTDDEAVGLRAKSTRDYDPLDAM